MIYTNNELKEKFIEMATEVASMLIKIMET